METRRAHFRASAGACRLGGLNILCVVGKGHRQIAATVGIIIYMRACCACNCVCAGPKLPPWCHMHAPRAAVQADWPAHGLCNLHRPASNGSLALGHIAVPVRFCVTCGAGGALRHACLCRRRQHRLSCTPGACRNFIGLLTHRKVQHTQCSYHALKLQRRTPH